MPTVPSPSEREARTGAKLLQMNKMQDVEVRRMAVFKLRQVVRQLKELEHCAADAGTRACLIAVMKTLVAGAEELQGKAIVIDGDDEARLAVL